MYVCMRTAMYAIRLWYLSWSKSRHADLHACIHTYMYACTLLCIHATWVNPASSWCTGMYVFICPHETWCLCICVVLQESMKNAHSKKQMYHSRIYTPRLPACTQTVCIADTHRHTHAHTFSHIKGAPLYFLSKCKKIFVSNHPPSKIWSVKTNTSMYVCMYM